MGILDSFKKALGGKTEAEAGENAVKAPAPAAGESAQPQPTPTVEPESVPAEKGSYTVQSGDTLWNIAESAYGDGSEYMKIFDANTNVLEHPDRILPGQQLLIPGLDD